MTNEVDELLRPTITSHTKRNQFPWRVSSQFWVAFIGGVPAIMVIAFLNAGRLGASASKRRWILVASGTALLVSFALLFWLRTMPDQKQTARWAVRVIAVVLYLILARIQRDDDGRHQVFGSGVYESLWVPGFLAILLSAVVMIGIALLGWSSLQ